MKSILVPTDFSPHADKALQFATAIAEKAGAEVILLHVTDQEVVAGDRRSMGEEYSHSIDHLIAQKLDAAQKGVKGNVKITTSITHGNLVTAVLDAVKKFGADLVVMGTLGASGIKKVVIGSKTAAVISKASVPVLSIPAGYTDMNLKEIVLAINHTEKDLHNLDLLFELANLFDARVRLAVFTGENDDAATYLTDRRTVIAMQDKLKSAYNKTDLEIEHLSGSDFQETLQHYINSNNIDLLVMITHKRGAIEGLFNRSITKEMAYHATLPLLSLHGNPYKELV